MDLLNGLFSDEPNEEIIQNDELPFTDGEWIADRFMVSGMELEMDYKYLRFASTADVKFTDSSMGGNISINCMPQYTRYADVRSTGMYGDRPKVKVGLMSSDYGMGRYYSEAIDDNSSNVFFEFGVPEFNNVLMYVMGAVDYKKAVIANSARSPFFYDVGWIFGTGALIVAFPIIAPILLLGKLAVTVGSAMLASNGKFDQYYLKRTMFLYWSSVNTLVTMMATELGLLSPMFDSNDPKKVGTPLKVDPADMEAIKKLMPGLITAGNGINVQAMVTKSQKLYNRMHEAKLTALDNISAASMDRETLDMLIRTTGALDPLDPITEDEEETLWDKIKGPVTNDKSFSKDDPKNKVTFSALLKELKEGGKELKDAFAADKDGTYKREARKQDEKGYIDKAMETTKAVFNEGARYAVFRVEHMPSTTESFSNSVDEIATGNVINSMGSTYRNMKFNIGLDGIPGLGSVVNAVTDFAVGATSGVTMGVSDVIGSILSGANVDVQKKWSKSDVSFPSLNFKMTLISPSAHPVAQLRNIYIPLASIMAGMLPLSTGPRSHTSPFLCSMFMRGRQQISLGMITSLSITRGTSNLPYNKQRRPLAIEVSFTVTDFSELISAPMPSGLLDINGAMFDDESSLSRYIQALCGRDLYSSTHVFNRAKIKMSRLFETADLITSPEYLGAKVGDMLDIGPAYSIFGGNKAVSYSELW